MGIGRYDYFLSSIANKHRKLNYVKIVKSKNCASGLNKILIAKEILRRTKISVQPIWKKDTEQK